MVARLQQWHELPILKGLPITFRTWASQNRLKVEGQDGVIDIQISTFGIGVKSLDST
jgi:hypothetical protein